jgi:hypothetical protein
VVPAPPPRQCSCLWTGGRHTVNNATLFDARRVPWSGGSCRYSVLELNFHKDCWRLDLNAGQCGKQAVWQVSWQVLQCSVSITRTLLSSQHELPLGMMLQHRTARHTDGAPTESQLRGGSAGQAVWCWQCWQWNVEWQRESKVECWSEWDGQRLRETGHGEVWLKPFKAQWSLYVPHSGQYMYRTVVTICTAQWSLYVPPV